MAKTGIPLEPRRSGRKGTRHNTGAGIGRYVPFAGRSWRTLGLVPLRWAACTGDRTVIEGGLAGLPMLVASGRAAYRSTLDSHRLTRDRSAGGPGSATEPPFSLVSPSLRASPSQPIFAGPVGRVAGRAGMRRLHDHDQLPVRYGRLEHARQAVIAGPAGRSGECLRI